MTIKCVTCNDTKVLFMGMVGGGDYEPCPACQVETFMGIKQQLSLNTLREANLSRHKEWDPSDQITIEFRGCELAGEAGEVCNVVKKLARERMGIRGPRETLEHLAEELADVIICADLIAMQMGIDLADAVRAKFNATSNKNDLKTRISVADIVVIT